MKAEYEQCQSHICSGTINSSMYDSYFSITTFPLKAVVEFYTTCKSKDHEVGRQAPCKHSTFCSIVHTAFKIGKFTFTHTFLSPAKDFHGITQLMFSTAQLYCKNY
jgi:hypothetical protein